MIVERTSKAELRPEEQRVRQRRVIGRKETLEILMGSRGFVSTSLSLLPQPSDHHDGPVPGNVREMGLGLRG